MYTQCPKCETVFRLSADVLRVASGQVRCGKCGEVFNALARLAEESGAFTTGESSLDLESRADSILRGTAPMPPLDLTPRESANFAAPDAQTAQLVVQDTDDSGDPAGAETEDTGSAAADSDDIYSADAGSADAVEDSAADAAADAAVDEFSAVFAAESSLEFTLPPGELDRIFVETKPRAPHPVTALRAAQEPGDEPIEVLDGLTRDAPYSTLARPARRFLALWLAAAIVLALLLAAQIVSNNQDRLGPSVRALYAALGSPLPAPANLAAYQLRQWGVTGDPDANGTLRLRASILNTTPQFQPFPLLRVTLADRFGGRIGTRDFEPAEYLGKPTARQLTPGERVDATLEILDPGKNAEGFEIDVCLRGADRRMACASDVPSQVKR